MKAKKRRIWMPLAALVMSLALVLSGCSSAGKDTESEVSSESLAEENEYKDLAGIYHSDLSEAGMDLELYLQIGENGEFVFSRDTNFSDNSKGAGRLAKDEEGNNTFVYNVVNGAEVAEGENVSRFEVTEEGGIQFLSLMWFGSTTPRITAEDGSETYPLFVPYDENAQKENTSSAVSSQESSSSSAASSSSKAPSTNSSKSSSTGGSGTSKPSSTGSSSQGSSASSSKPSAEPAGFQEGTYTGSYKKHIDAMDSDIRYDITMKLSGGTYNYQVNITVTGKMAEAAGGSSPYKETQSHSGKYTVSGTSLTLTGGDLSSGTVNKDGSLSITGTLSGFASGKDTVTLYR